MSSNTAAKTPANTTTKTRMMVQIAMLTAVAEVPVSYTHLTLPTN